VGQIFATQDAAESWLASQRGALRSGTFVDPRDGSILLKAFFEEDFLPGRALRPKTLENYRWLFDRYIDETFGQQQLSAMRPAAANSDWEAFTPFAAAGQVLYAVRFPYSGAGSGNVVAVTPPPACWRGDS